MSAEFRLLNFEGEGGKARPGILVDDSVVDLGKIPAPRVDVTSTLTILEDWAAADAWLGGLAGEVAGGKHGNALMPRDSVSLMAPLLYPSTIFCIASNYLLHRQEMGNDRPMPPKEESAPVFFQKTPRQTVVGDGAVIHLPRTSSAIDWESEVAVVIGKPAYCVSKEDAFDYVAGYTIMNDMSIRGPRQDEVKSPRDDQFRRDRFRRKNFDGSAPMGPWITPKECIEDIYDQPIRLWVNGDQMQDGNSGDMWWRIEEQVAYLSEHLTLAPGDVISTGTPHGVGKGRGVFLKAGDEIVTTIGDLGTLRTSFTDPK